MTKKIFRSIIIVAFTVLFASFAFIMSSLYQYFTAEQNSQLEIQLELAAKAVENEGIPYLKSLKTGEYRLTLVDKNGNIMYDTKSDLAKMENHSNREEIQQALASGSGKATRFSQTLTEKTDYIAKRLSDGTVLRISANHFTFITLIMRMLQPLCIVLVIALILSVTLATRLSKNIVKPLNDLSFEQPLDNDAYEELAPILRHINIQNIRIKNQIEQLNQKKREFAAITDNMSEGLVLLNENGIVVSINTAAKKLLSADESYIGKDFLTIDRDPVINNCIQQSPTAPYVETYVNKDNRDYLFRFSKIEKDSKIIGTVVLVIDVTEKMQAEKNRREFTANVSHELKSPLQSIIGSAELIENGLVKPEDMPRFIGHIKTDASRLVTLINDIIRLSQLDENTMLPKENVDVLATAQEATETLKTVANKNGISITVEGKSVIVQSVHRLVYEIIYNLCDNAIKYNKKGGSVNISVLSESGKAKIIVVDTGIGIAKKHQQRIFERFYRVDKSHSRETGGTGLGLSIVKHAVSYLNGEITLKSEPNVGTTITVVLP